MEGYIKLHRVFLEWEWYDDLKAKSLFIHCLLKANHEPKKWRGINIKRGQFVTSLKNLSLETGLSVQSIRTSIEKLEKTNELTHKSTKLNTTITVVNYNKYQSNQQTSNTPPTNEQQTSNKQPTTTKNDKNEKNDKKEENKEKPFNFFDSLLEIGVEEQVAQDYMEVRKKKKGANTLTAFNGLLSEIGKSNMKPNECIKTCVERNWLAFKNDWLKNKSEQKEEKYNFKGFSL